MLLHQTGQKVKTAGFFFFYDYIRTTCDIYFCTCDRLFTSLLPRLSHGCGLPRQCWCSWVFLPSAGSPTMWFTSTGPTTTQKWTPQWHISSPVCAHVSLPLPTLVWTPLLSICSANPLGSSSTSSFAAAAHPSLSVHKTLGVTRDWVHSKAPRTTLWPASAWSMATLSAIRAEQAYLASSSELNYRNRLVQPKEELLFFKIFLLHSTEKKWFKTNHV